MVGFAVIYRVRVHAAMEEAYVAAWCRITERLRSERGGLGSRLHRGPDGIWYAYAQWPSAEARQQAFAQGPIDPEAEATMRAAIAERLPELALDPVADFLIALPERA
ncbi:MAG: antibiotic biosynthesis monooxygenase [Pseudomonadota bacterium]|nr:antibiotic biosynthesis monooxygenase [Pseudomonadota bacterium]